MEISYRDDAISKNKRLLKLSIVWALMASFSLVLMIMLCFYLIVHKETHWLPFSSNTPFSIGEKSFSPSYLREMSEKIASLRLTYNADIIDERYQQLLHFVEIDKAEAFKKILHQEAKTVHEKNISSVFYMEKLSVIPNESKVILKGTLSRTSHGLMIEPKNKTYVMQFSYSGGLLWLHSIKDM